MHGKGGDAQTLMRSTACMRPPRRCIELQRLVDKGAGSAAGVTHREREANQRAEFAVRARILAASAIHTPEVLVLPFQHLVHNCFLPLTAF